MKYLIIAPVAALTAGLIYWLVRPKRRIPRWFRSDPTLSEHTLRERRS